MINYEAPVNYAGPDSFQYTVADGQGGANTAQVAMTVVRPRITAWSAAGGILHLEFKGIPNRAYFLQTSENLKDWNELLVPVTDSGGMLLLDRAATPGESQRFYRFKW